VLVEDLPAAHTVSYVNSSASMNSSTLTSGTCPMRDSACSSCFASSTRKVSIDPAPSIGLMIAG
jgi:hypothetical protein